MVVVIGETVRGFEKLPSLHFTLPPVLQVAVKLVELPKQIFVEPEIVGFVGLLIV